MSPRKKKAPPRRITAFLDTNTFLHFLPFDQIPWAKELGADVVQLRVAAEVVGELNKHKDKHGIGHLRERAGKILRRIMQFALKNQGRIGDSDAVTISCDQRTVGMDFLACGLDPEITDDRILAAVIAYKEQHPAEEVVLVTDDAGAALRAHSYGVSYAGLSEPMRIPAAPDEKQKRIRELEERISVLQGGQPRLSLSFPDGQDVCEFTVEPDFIVTEGAAQAYAAGEVAKLSPHQTGVGLKNMAEQSQQTEMESDELRAIMQFVGTAAGMLAINAQARLVEFQSNCVKYYLAAWRHANEMRRTKEIRLILENKGPVPAEEITVRLRLPNNNIAVFPEGKLMPAPAPPVAPGTPAPQQKLLPKSKLVSPVRTAFEYIGHQELPGRLELRYRLARLNQHLNEQLVDLYIHFRSPAGVIPFEIEYLIAAGNSPDKVEGTLHMIPNPPEPRKPRQIAKRRKQ
jgi:hypothetical protein